MQKSTSKKNPVFVLGVGAQKAGTTWLHRYLNGYDCADFGAIKEYHIWDVLDMEEISTFDGRTRKRRFNELLTRRIRKSLDDLKRMEIRFKFQTYPEQYFDYFADLLKQDGIRLTGDISPSYCGLPQDTLKKIQDEFAKRDIDVRVAFLMRDPVDRLWSAVKMYNRKDRIRGGVEFCHADEEALLTYMSTPHARLRNSYPETLENIYSVFPSEKIFVGIHENMFTDEEVERLSNFLDLEPNIEFAKQRINSDPKKARSISQKESISFETRRKVQAEYADIHKYCAAKYPQIVNLWGRWD